MVHICLMLNNVHDPAKMMRCNKKDDDVGDHYGLWIIMVNDGICVAFVCFALLIFFCLLMPYLPLVHSLWKKVLKVDVRMSISITW